MCNAPATFQRIMDVVLAGVQWSTCLVYLDNIIVIAYDFDEYLQKLGVVLQKLKESGLQLKPNKCALCQELVSYLGHIVSREGVAIDPEKTNNFGNVGSYNFAGSCDVDGMAIGEVLSKYNKRLTDRHMLKGRAASESSTYSWFFDV